MNALTKSAAVLASVTMFAAAVPAQAAMGPCMPMMMSGFGMPACNSQPAPQEKAESCPVPEDKGTPSFACAGNGQMAAMMGDMAVGGMGIAMAVMAAIFGPPHE